MLEDSETQRSKSSQLLAADARAALRVTQPSSDEHGDDGGQEQLANHLHKLPVPVPHCQHRLCQNQRLFGQERRCGAGLTLVLPEEAADARESLLLVDARAARAARAARPLRLLHRELARRVEVRRHRQQPRPAHPPHRKVTKPSLGQRELVMRQRIARWERGSGAGVQT
eukprot:3159133-Rhodomonas_salina.2